MIGFDALVLKLLTKTNGSSSSSAWLPSSSVLQVGKIEARGHAENVRSSHVRQIVRPQTKALECVVPHAAHLEARQLLGEGRRGGIIIAAVRGGGVEAVPLEVSGEVTHRKDLAGVGALGDPRGHVENWRRVT